MKEEISKPEIYEQIAEIHNETVEDNKVDVMNAY